MIHLLTHEAWRGQLPAPSHTGISPLFKGRLHAAGESRRCFIKPLPDSIKTRYGEADNMEVVSEALGYALAKACGLPVPDTVGVVVLPRDVIPEPVLRKADAITPGQPQQEFVSWFSEDMRHPNLVQHHHLHLHGANDDDFQQRLVHRISRHLAEHEQSPALASFDEWTLNTDRHPGNLLQGPAGQLILIDHGRLFLNPTWQPQHLSGFPSTAENRLVNCIEITSPEWSKRLPTQNKRHLAYNGFNVSFRETGEEAARQVLDQLLLEEPDIEEVITFLAARLRPDHYSKAIGTLL